jgi:hypothetical protein
VATSPSELVRRVQSELFLDPSLVRPLRGAPAADGAGAERGAESDSSGASGADEDDDREHAGASL